MKLVWVSCLLLVCFASHLLATEKGLAGFRLDALASSTADEQVALRSDTQTLVILSEPFDFQTEQASFKQFSNHYLVYWTLWMSMLLGALVWNH